MDALTEGTIETTPPAAVAPARIHPVILCGEAGDRSFQPLPALASAGFAFGYDESPAGGGGWLAAPVIVCVRDATAKVADGLSAQGITPHTIVAVPCTEGPARALTAAALLLIATDPEAIMLVCAGSFDSGAEGALREVIGEAAAEAQRGTFVLFGSAAGEVRPEPGLLMVAARRFLQEIELSAPKVLDGCADAVALAVRKDGALYLARPSYEAAPSLSIDAAVMARGAGTAVFPLPAGEETGVLGTSTIERAFGDTSGDMPTAEEVPVVTENEVVRPWGAFRTVDRGRRFQVKQIVVKPGARLSLQMHHHRAEHWIVVAGTARVVCGDDERLLYENDHAFIRPGEKHRLENPGKVPLRVIEVQSGSYLGEDDIVRFEDVYGRVPS